MSPRRESGVTVDVEGLEEALRRIGALDMKAQNLAPAFRLFDTQVRTFLDLQFRTAGTFGQERWEELSDEAKAARRRPGGNRGGVNRPLWDTGHLRRSLTDRPIRSFGAQVYARGTDVPYARRQGRKDGPRPIFPERRQPFLDKALLVALRTYLESELGGGG